jgi:hypothetical protein
MPPIIVIMFCLEDRTNNKRGEPSQSQQEHKSNRVSGFPAYYLVVMQLLNLDIGSAEETIWLPVLRLNIYSMYV